MITLTGYVDTSLPGFRSFTIDGDAEVVPSGYYHWPDYLAAVTSAGLAASMSAAYRVTLTGDPSQPVVWGDRMGWLLGFDAEPGDAAPEGAGSDAHLYSPAAIPCLGGTWLGVQVEREEVTETDRWRRAHGYQWGGAAVWRLELLLTAAAFAALEAGWLLRGRIRLAPSGATTAWAVDNPGGYVEGVCLGIESDTWENPTVQSIARVVLLVARAAPDAMPEPA